jgi:hypothetical protein
MNDSTRKLPHAQLETYLADRLPASRWALTGVHRSISGSHVIRARRLPHLFWRRQHGVGLVDPALVTHADP